MNKPPPTVDSYSLFWPSERATIEDTIGGPPVADRSGDSLGTIAESDLFEALAQQLERLAGSC